MYANSDLDAKAEKIYRYSSLPVGWTVVKAKNIRSPAPPGWVWAHNDRDMFSRSFRKGLVRLA